MKTVAIVGVGLIGGSFALALRRAGFTGKILGVSSRDAVDKALAGGVIDTGASLEAALPQADLVYLSQSIGRILEAIPLLNAWVRPDALITDAGSTKAAIVEAASESITRSQFLGGHPLAGKETRGVESATADLFEGRTYVLTPLRASDLETAAASDFTSWLKRIGAVPIVMTPKDHDQTLAFTSHLPQLVSTALAALMGRTGSKVQDAFGPALLDSTRLALSSYDLWKDILDTNHPEVALALDHYIATLQDLRTKLSSEGLQRYFSDGAEFAGKIRHK